ncbi:glucoamylase 1 isoform X6 [Hevea brasiliensis]|uniref:glucoamylase 1 isoform X6 n=1 Tax=Hevea brasiliensis TaxID=3981 RepID=UPI0025F7FD85|nr:glucoamylase 1 isoform X6 [Hevea brasiliensis]
MEQALRVPTLQIFSTIHSQLPPLRSIFTLTTFSKFRSFRKKRLRLSTKFALESKMAGHEGKTVTSDVKSGNMIFEPILEDGVFRFDCPGDDRLAAYPSLSFINSKDRDTSIISHSVPSYIPTFECVLGQQIVKLELPSGTSFYGTGEVSGPLERTGKRVFAWNTDAWGYGPGTTSLYQSHPWVLAITPNGEAMGVLADTTLRCEVDLRKESIIQFIASASYPIITFGPFASPTAVLKSFSHAIGTVFMPPKWSLGYQQCRWSYDSDTRVREIAKTFRTNGIPCDVIWMDIDYMDGFRCFTFDQGLSGQPFSGPDIGGFAGNATPKLFGRWMGVGAMFPFCRGHSETGTLDHEPWSFGEECEEVCRLALKRRYRLIPHLYTLFYAAHTTGTPVAMPTFFADPKDPNLRTLENSFLLGPLLVYASTIPDQGTDKLQHDLPKGIWLRFDFDDSHPDLPTLYLQGGSIIPLGPPHQHVGEANLSDDLTLIVALDEYGKAKGVLFEDDGDGYEFTNGGYLLTHYVAELQSSVVTVRVSGTEGSWKRPNRRLHVQLLLGGSAMVDSWGMDGDVVQIMMPSESDVSELVSASEKKYRSHLESSKHIPDFEEVSGPKGAKLSRIPIELKSGDWIVKIVPWIGGRIISMEHLPSGTQWLHSRIEINGYEEYSGTEYRSAGCSEEYKVIEQDLEHAGEDESLILEGDIGGGLVIQRQIFIQKDDPKILHIDSSIVAQKVGAGSGGFSRLVCLRVHPTFTLLHPMETFVSFTSIDGSKHEIKPESGDQFYEGNLLPHGEWMLVDKCLGVGLVNRFNVKEVYKCYIHWGTGTVNLELWSEERPVSRQSPLKISHEYEVEATP